MRVSAARYTLFALAFSLLWASGFPAIKIAFRYSPPLLLMASRFPATWGEWRRIALLGLLNNACYLGVTAVPQLHLSAGMGAVLASSNPPMLALVAP